MSVRVMSTDSSPLLLLDEIPTDDLMEKECAESQHEHLQKSVANR